MGRGIEMEEKVLQECGKRGMMVTTGGRVRCPVCKTPTTLMVTPQTSGKNIPAYCRKCKTTTLVNIEHGQCSSSPC